MLASEQVAGSGGEPVLLGQSEVISSVESVPL